MATDLIQIDPALPTGFVTVDVDEAGSPDYEILRPVAWDSLEATDAALERSARARAVVFGSLAQRSASARDTIRRLSAAATFRVFDVNLRIPYDDPGIVRRSLEGADLVKLNQQELTTLSGWLGLPTGVREAARAIAESFGTGVVCVTRGADGAALLRDGRWSEHAGFPVEVADTVGAGDAFLAALLQGLLTGEDDAVTLDRACLLGSFVASRRGALPKHEQEELARLAERRRVWDHVEGRSPAMRAE